MRYTRKMSREFKVFALPLRRLPAIVVLLAASLLQACAGVPEEDAQAPATVDTEPELNINLPEQGTGPCTPVGVDYTFLDKGFSALVAGDHIEAVTYFQRYQRIENSPRADWEAGIAIAYDSMLPQSPFYDAAAARKSFERLGPRPPGEGRAHEKILMMRDSLATFAALETRINELEGDKAVLAENLAKREEAIKRLRELTLGQKAATP